MLLASRAGNVVFRRYHDIICERFWRGELDIEDGEAVRSLFVEAGAQGRDFDDSIASGEGSRKCREIAPYAEQRGVFGVPTFVLQETGELFRGTDRVWLLRERLSANAWHPTASMSESNPMVRAFEQERRVCPRKSSQTCVFNLSFFTPSSPISTRAFSTSYQTKMFGFDQHTQSV
jgi:hypothetical protein